MYIAIAGNIGSGKTTLTGKLAEHFGWEPRYESADDNPYLEDFYGDMSRWAFPLQIYFLNSRFRQVMEVSKTHTPIIQDRSIYEDAHIFARQLNQDGHLSDRDNEVFQNVFSSVADHAPAPDLLIYLRTSVPQLLDHIRKRGREYEQSISRAYLTGLNEFYEEWISNYDKGKLLVIEMEDLDFVENEAHFDQIVANIDAELQAAKARV
ncbi:MULTISPECIES: deoxynucleoside kinase [unclassified Flammeovirga]|uniref:deoxynucleoside kinase n=1 Tax=unclassified Flammeovirga TaxID=2637820 RepID=UPI0005C6E740|nr:MULTISPECIES: deoxynucleoside kinase [unclassified Flammeovirga]MBD0399901.1 deoxynucleoside kinase [Flammeovirga sp. EKP202]